MSTLLIRSMLLCVLTLLWCAAPASSAFAEGQATGKRTHKPLRASMYYDQSITLDGEDLTIGSLMEEEGIFIVLLPEDPDQWDLEFIQQLARDDRKAEFPNIAKLAVYPTTKYVKYAQEDLDHLGEILPVYLMDDTTRLFLPEPDDQVLVAFFSGDRARFEGTFRDLDSVRKAVEQTRQTSVVQDL